MGARLSVKSEDDFYKKFPDAPENFYQEQRERFRKYAKEDEDGVLGLNTKEWHKAVKVGKEDKEFSTIAFMVADTNGDDYVQWFEYITALGYITFGTFEQKFRVAFSLHDEDGNGILDKEELVQAVTVTLIINECSRGKECTEDDVKDEAKFRAKMILEKCDLDGDGNVDIDEMYTAYQEHPEIFGDLLFFSLVEGEEPTQ